jgi:hypothetical protein
VTLRAVVERVEPSTAVDRLESPFKDYATGTILRSEATHIDLPEILLNGGKVDFKIRNAITDAEIIRTMDGASELRLDLLDPRHRLLNSKVWEGTTDVRIDDLTFRLARTQVDGEQLSLTFEDREVAILRSQKKKLKAYRDQMTRAQFALKLIREPKKRIRWYIPELHKKRRVMRSGDRPTRREKEDRRERGLNPGQTLYMSDHALNRVALGPSNIRIADEILDVGTSMGVNYRLLVTAIAVSIHETLLSNPDSAHSDRDSAGPFQQRPSQGWGNSEADVRDVSNSARLFFTAARAYQKQNPNATPYQINRDVQRGVISGAFRKNVLEAREIVDAYRGGSTSAGSDGGDFTAPKRYAFTRGTQGQKENSWRTLIRLAEEVNWRCFVNRGRVYFVSDEYLIRSKPVAVLDFDTEGVINISGEYDRREDVDQVTVQMDAKRWVAPPGSVILIENCGALDQRYLVHTIRRSLFDTVADVTLVTPRKEKPEPAAPTGSESFGGERGASGGGGDGDVDYRGAKVLVDSLFDIARAATNGNIWLPPGIQYRPGDYTSNGSPSDHGGNGSNLAARDICDRRVNALTGPPTPELDRAFRAIMDALGQPNARPGAWINVYKHGFRIQIGWRVADHYGHIHVGAKR